MKVLSYSITQQQAEQYAPQAFAILENKTKKANKVQWIIDVDVETGSGWYPYRRLTIDQELEKRLPHMTCTLRVVVKGIRYKTERLDSIPKFIIEDYRQLLQKARNEYESYVEQSR